MQAMEYNAELLEFIENHPTGYHVVSGQAELLEAKGYVRLSEGQGWELVPGGKYYVIRNDSAIAAFRIPTAAFSGFMIMASHGDSPALKVKKHPEIRVGEAYQKLNVEPYGGLVMAQWLDRPLSVAGRIMVRRKDGFETRLVNVSRDLLVIPGLAIHMNRSVNKGYEFHAQKDLLPLYGGIDSCGLMETVAAEAGIAVEELLDFDLFLYNRQRGGTFGAAEEFLYSPRLDDVQCAYASLKGFLESEKETDFLSSSSEADGKKYEIASEDTAFSLPVHIVFDNEEVGSSTRQGAASTFLSDTLERISEALGESRSAYLRHLSRSFMLSADNAHALHPNHTEKSDPVSRPVLNGGVVLKHSANQKYTTDAMSASVVRILAERAGITLQEFHNHSDQPGGSTLGNLSCNQVAVCTADVGIAQLSMHSSCETCGARDTSDLVKLARELYASAVVKEGDVWCMKSTDSKTPTPAE